MYSEINTILAAARARSNPCRPQGENYISIYNIRWLSNVENNTHNTRLCKELATMPHRECF